MTDEFTARDSMAALISDALRTLAYLYAHSRVTITNLWADTGSGPGVTAHETMIVKADVTGLPEHRGAVLAGLAPVTEPTDWTGQHGTYREWSGVLLTMRVIVWTRVEADLPDVREELHGAEFEATDDVSCDRPVCLGTSVHAIGACGWPGPHPEHPVGNPAVMDPPVAIELVRDPILDPAYLASHVTAWTRGIHAGRVAAKYLEPVAEPDHRPLLGLLVDERYGTLQSHVLEVYGQPGQSTDDLAEGYRDAPGVLVVEPRKPVVSEDEVRESFKGYAIARVVYHFETTRPGYRFPTLADALTAINVWPGRDMLDDDWVVEAAQRLVDLSAPDDDRDPAVAAGAVRGRLRRMLPAALRGRGGEVVIR